MNRARQIGGGVLLVTGLLGTAWGSVGPLEQNARDRIAPPLDALEEERRSSAVRSLENLSRLKLDALLQALLRRVEQIDGISKIQRETLEAAGNGDISRFMNRVERCQSKLAAEGDPGTIRSLLQEQFPLILISRAGPFGKESLFGKLLKKTLTAEQFAQYEAIRRRDAAELAAQSVRRQIKCSEEQHQQLVDLIVKKAPPLPQIGTYYEIPFFLLELSRLPESELSAILGDTQTLALKKGLRAYGTMEPYMQRLANPDE